MNFPKLVIASDGTYTGVLLDGVFIGQGVRRLEFLAQNDLAQNEGGEMKSTIRIMDLDVGCARLVPDASKFANFIEKLADSDLTAPAATDAVM